MKACLYTARLALAVLVSTPACDAPTMPSPDLARMIDQNKLLPYAASSAFADGRAMRDPPLGSVPHDAPDDGDRDLQDTAPPPYPITLGALRRGRANFEAFCAPCHGLLGDGASAVAERMELRRPPSLVSRDVLPPARIVRTIATGYGLMRSYDAEIPSSEDRWAIAAYLGALRLRRAVALDGLPHGVRQRAEAALP